jgi:hypothetical protein
VSKRREVNGETGIRLEGGHRFAAQAPRWQWLGCSFEVWRGRKAVQGLHDLFLGSSPARLAASVFRLYQRHSVWPQGFDAICRRKIIRSTLRRGGDFEMFFAAMVLIVSTSLLFFYLQRTCERVLREQFDQEYFQAIARVCRLEFPSLRLAMEQRDARVDYASVCAKLRLDLTFLSSLKETTHLAGHPRLGERLLAAYFHGILLALPLLRAAGVGKRALGKLTEILQHCSNAVGKQLSCAQPAEPLTP